MRLFPSASVAELGRFVFPFSKNRNVLPPRQRAQTAARDRRGL